MSGGAAPAEAKKSAKDRWLAQSATHTAARGVRHEEFYAFLEEKQILQLEAEAEQMDSERSQLSWEEEQKHWEEIYLIYANEHAVSMRQLEIAKAENWVEDIKQRQKEADTAWVIAVDAKNRAENALENAKASLVRAQIQLSEAQGHLKQRQNAIIAEYERVEAHTAESLKKCHELRPVLRPVLASGSCRIEEERHSAASRRTSALKQSHQLSAKGEIDQAHKWEATANNHTKELAQLNTEQFQYRTKLAGGVLVFAIAAATMAWFLIAVHQLKMRRNKGSEANRLDKASQAIVNLLLNEELYIHMLEVLDEVIEDDDRTQFIINITVAIRLASLVIASGKITFDDWYDPAKQASISSTSAKQLESDKTSLGKTED